MCFQNSGIPSISRKESMESTRDLYLAVFGLLDECENFKTKITAVYGLCCPRERRTYGPMYWALVRRITSAINNVDDLDANGYAKQKYRELLKYRLIELLSHLVSLNEYNDEKKRRKLHRCIQLSDPRILRYCLQINNIFETTINIE